MVPLELLVPQKGHTQNRPQGMLAHVQVVFDANAICRGPDRAQDWCTKLGFVFVGSDSAHLFRWRVNVAFALRISLAPSPGMGHIFNVFFHCRLATA